VARVPPPAPPAAIRPATAGDAAAIARIYAPYVRETTITFEEEPVTPAAMAQRMADAAGAGLPWLVATRAETVVGYAYAARWKGRCAYRYSVESTIYLDLGARRGGIGTVLYAALLERLRSRGYHAVIGGIALPNDASVRLHEKLGFRKVAHFPEVGFKLGRWVDVGYWQIIL